MESEGLDARDDEIGLTKAEALGRNEVQAQLLLNFNNRKSLLSQKAQLRWLKSGGVNSEIFHRAINRRRSSNGFAGLKIDVVWVEDPTRIKSAVKNHFSHQFQRRDDVKLDMPTDLFEATLDEDDGAFLTRAFSEDEIK